MREEFVFLSDEKQPLIIEGDSLPPSLRRVWDNQEAPGQPEADTADASQDLPGTGE